MNVFLLQTLIIAEDNIEKSHVPLNTIYEHKSDLNGARTTGQGKVNFILANLQQTTEKNNNHDNNVKVQHADLKTRTKKAKREEQVKNYPSILLKNCLSISLKNYLSILLKNYLSILLKIFLSFL